MTRKFITRILVAIFALSLISGMAVAQATAAPAKGTTAAASADLLDINSATKDQLGALPGIGAVKPSHRHRRGLTAYYALAAHLFKSGQRCCAYSSLIVA